MSRRLLQYALAAALFTTAAFAQDSKSSVSVNVTGVANKDTITTGVQQSPTNSAGFLASYRRDLSKHNAVEVNYGFMRNNQNYTTADTAGSIQAGVHEFTAAYVYKMPFAKFTPFLTAGSGALVFRPTDNVNNLIGASTQAKAAFLYGGGIDYNAFKHVTIRAQYRGLVYRAPDFNLSALTADKTTHTAEPSVGFVFHF